MISRYLEAFIDTTGRAISWLTLALVLIMVGVVILRFGFDVGWVWLQESTNYLHAFIFMLGAAYTLKHDGHVRVDILYRKLSLRGQAWVDLLGTVFLLLPMCGFIFFVSWDVVITSWQQLEPSQRTGGLDFAYLLKSSMLIMPLLMGIQGIAVVIQKAQFLRQPASGSN